MKKLYLLYIIILLSLTLCTASCSGYSQRETLDRAESIMEAHPDSALNILEDIDRSKLGSKKERARYALLMSMSLDKNYIDTTTFDVLQPAIDYYLKKGNPDEKLRTYYYQGRIYQNQGDLDNALNSFTKGIDIAPESNDSLCIARTLVGQGYLYDEFYDFGSYTDCFLRAAKIYNRLSLSWHEFDCLLNALNGTIASGDNVRGDSILALCENYSDTDSIQEITFSGYRLSYALKFGDIHRIKQLIEHPENNRNLNTSGLLSLALAYHKTGNDVKAKHLLDSINRTLSFDTLKYQAILVPVLENMGDYKGALITYKEFSQSLDSIDAVKFDQKSKSIEEKHLIELKAQEDAQEKTKIIWGCIGGIVFLISITLILYLLFRSNKSQKDLAVERAKTSELENRQLKSDNEMALQRAKITELENDSLKSEKERLSLENKNLQLERDKKALEAENLSHRVETLENESASLKELIDSQEELPLEVQKSIKVRIEMLNALMAGYITNNNQFEKPYESWIKDLTDNTEEFMNSNRLAFQASHPRFIQYFEEHGLTVGEINYVCLYAIGLRGKEVGNYIKKRSHVNISSAIRKKLGIDKHETNIGIYVRKLLKGL